jgi:cell division protein ZapA
LINSFTGLRASIVNRSQELSERVGGMGRERLVEIKVFGQTYTVKTDAEEDYIQEVAKYVNEKMEEVLRKTKSVSTLNVAILTALNVADDLLREREKRTALLREVETKSKDLVEKIDIKIGEWNLKVPS